MSLADLRTLVAHAEQQHDERTLAEIAAQAGVGVRALQSRERTADLARRRSVVAWALADHLGWTQTRIARALSRTPRQIKRMLRKERVVSPFMVT